MKAMAAALVLVLESCTTPPDLTPALVGTWGGDHVGLSVGELDAGIEFDCAEGVVFGPYMVGRDGRFGWAGSFERSSGGPARIDQQPKPIQAHYFGTVRGPAMVLNVRLADGTTLGPFQLERFREARLTRCL
ncbi:MAG: hypothetical protein ABIN83_06635 [Sphingomicrobium sp.]